MVSTQEGGDYNADLTPVIEKADDISQPLGEVWTDGLSAYQVWNTITARLPTTWDMFPKTASIRTDRVSLITAPAVVKELPPSPSRAWSRPLVTMTSSGH